MIYITTFILALLLTQIACAQSQTCGDAVSPELSTSDEQHNFPPIPIIEAFATYWERYDDKKELLKNTYCSNLSPRYRSFGDIPSFPRIGGAPDIRNNPSNCGACWNITNKEKPKNFIYLTAIDRSDFDFFNISEEAFKILNDGKVGFPFAITADKVPLSYCSRR
jgi:hypothetical protein